MSIKRTRGEKNNGQVEDATCDSVERTGEVHVPVSSGEPKEVPSRRTTDSEETAPAVEAELSIAAQRVESESATASARAARALSEAYTDERDDVLSVINELEDQLDRYEDIRETLERDLSHAQEGLQQANQRVQELEWQVVTLQTRADAQEQVRGEITLLEEEIADANTRGQRLTTQLTEVRKENTRLAEELKAANRQLDELWTVRKQRDGLQVDLRNTRAKLEQSELLYREAAEERASLQGRLNETQALFEEHRDARNEAELALRAALDHHGELTRVRDTLEQKIEALRNERNTARAQMTHLERENARLREQQQFFECEITSLRGMNRGSESALISMKKAFAEVRGALAETKARARRRTVDRRTWAVGTGIATDAAHETTHVALGEDRADAVNAAASVRPITSQSSVKEDASA